MGNINKSQSIDDNNAIISAKQLQGIMNDYPNCPKKKEILKYVPVRVNYKLDRKTKIIKKIVPCYRKNSKSLSFHFGCTYFYDECSIEITQQIYQKIIDFKNSSFRNNECHVCRDIVEQVYAPCPHIQYCLKCIRSLYGCELCDAKISQ